MIQVADGTEGQPSLLADLTPLLDVIFIVMVFLMLSANVTPLALPVDLPSQGAERAEAVEETQTMTVSMLNGDIHWGLDGQEVANWDELVNELLAARGENPDLRVIIAGDRDVPMERLVQLLSFLQEEHWPAASILMEAED